MAYYTVYPNSSSEATGSAGDWVCTFSGFICHFLLIDFYLRSRAHRLLYNHRTWEPNVAVLLKCAVWTNRFPPTKLWDLNRLLELFSHRREIKAVPQGSRIHYLYDSIENSSMFFKFIPVWSSRRNTLWHNMLFEALRYFPCGAPFSTATDQTFVKQLQ